MGIQIDPQMDSPVEATMWRVPTFSEVHLCNSGFSHPLNAQRPQAAPNLLEVVTNIV